MAKRKWKDLPRGARRGIIALGIVQVGLIGIAHGDITRRPDDLVWGPKRMWRLISLVNFVGPVAYFLVGRIPPDAKR